MALFDPVMIEEIFRKAVSTRKPGKRGAFVSSHLLGIPYTANTLNGDAAHPEPLVINPEGVDCMTFIEYVEAIRRSATYEDFVSNLAAVRYFSGIVSFENRRHFFSDWTEGGGGFIEDFTVMTGGFSVRQVHKRLNVREDGGVWVPGAGVRERIVSFIPAESVNEDVIGRLETGDYIGIYSEKAGLDVSHTGIFLHEAGRIIFRHASSKSPKCVTDQAFDAYLQGKPGIVVLRPLVPAFPRP